MKKLLLIGLVTVFSTGVFAEDKTASLGEMAKAIRSGTVDVGKKYSLEEDARYHTIHVEKLGMKCANCHTSAAYPENYLYLRKAEFPNRDKIKAVKRANCIGCHSEGGVATPFYNITGK
jgi:hypothetical protein